MERIDPLLRSLADLDEWSVVGCSPGIPVVGTVFYEVA
jgi:hypothetical protein